MDDVTLLEGLLEIGGRITLDVVLFFLVIKLWRDNQIKQKEINKLQNLRRTDAESTYKLIIDLYKEANGKSIR